MRHLMVCREYPPAAGGGIGSYAARIATLLADRGETVHVVGQRWTGAEAPVERSVDGRLVVHRVPCERPGRRFGLRPHAALAAPEARALLGSAYYPQSFAWSVAHLVERLVVEENIDVIEAPEYEASLYFFQLRRILGFGPDRQPPCVIHLHSPTETIVRHNNWDLGHPYFLTAKRLEDFSIGAADALLCPSAYLAAEVSAREDLQTDAVRVIPYPAPHWEPSRSAPGPKDGGPVVYVGRLERRKGTLEWLDAAVAVARLRPQARFEFVGRTVLDTDWRPGGDVVRERVPSDVRDRFRFHGPKRPSEVRSILESARLATVPSRWDNFPNTCMEAMSMGLPVLVTPNGGMVQLIDDGVSGWVTDDAETPALVGGLLRALDTPAAELATMGRRAGAAVRERCDPDRVIRAHLDFKSALVGSGPRRSTRMPPASGRYATDPGAVPPITDPQPQGIAVLLVCRSDAHAEACLVSVRAQTRPPVRTLVAHFDAAGNAGALPAADHGVETLAMVQPDRARAIRAGVADLLAGTPPPEGIVVLDRHDRLLPVHLERCGHVLATRPEVGLVSFWEGVGNTVRVPPCPTRAIQWLWNEAAAASVFRSAALRSIADLPSLEDSAYERWYLANGALGDGWAGVSVPERLADREVPDGWVGRLDSTEMIRAIHEPFAELIAEDAPSLLTLTRSGFAGTLGGPDFRPREYAELGGRLLSGWKPAARWAWTKWKGKWRRG